MTTQALGGQRNTHRREHMLARRAVLQLPERAHQLRRRVRSRSRGHRHADHHCLVADKATMERAAAAAARSRPHRRSSASSPCPTLLLLCFFSVAPLPFHSFEHKQQQHLAASMYTLHTALGGEDCTFVRDTFRNISQNYCPVLERYSKWVYIGLVLVSTAVMLSLIFWVIYARERRHQAYNKAHRGNKPAPMGGNA